MSKIENNNPVCTMLVPPYLSDDLIRSWVAILGLERTGELISEFFEKVSVKPDHELFIEIECPCGACDCEDDCETCENPGDCDECEDPECDGCDEEVCECDYCPGLYRFIGRYDAHVAAILNSLADLINEEEEFEALCDYCEDPDEDEDEFDEEEDSDDAGEEAPADDSGKTADEDGNAEAEEGDPETEEDDADFENRVLVIVLEL